MDDAAYFFQRGIAKDSNGNNNEGISDIIIAIDLNPKIADHLFTEEAMSCPGNIIVEDLTKVITLLPEWSAGYKKRASLKSDIGDYQGSLEDYASAIQLEPGNTDLLLERAEIKIFIGLYDDAENDFKAALRLSPNNSKIYIIYAEFLWNFQIQRRKDIVDLLIPVLYFEINEYTKKHVKQFIVDTICGTYFSVYDNYLDDINGYSTIDEWVTDDMDVNLDMNTIINDNAIRIIDDLNRIIEIIPEWDIPYFIRGFISAVFLHNHESAIDDYNKFIDLNPDDANAYYNRGESKFYIHDIDSAELDFNIAVELEPNENFTPYELGEQYSYLYEKIDYP